MQEPRVETVRHIPPAPPRQTSKPIAPATVKSKQVSASPVDSPRVLQAELKPLSKASPMDSSRTLQYDDGLGFEANLEQLKRFCDEHKTEADLESLTFRFVETAIRLSKDQFAGLRNALEKNEGQPIYKNILLACLMSADGPVDTKASLVWGMATNQDQPASVRRTAAYLSGQIDSETKRPEAFHSLLTDPDENVVIFALTSANRNINLDQANYDLIKTSLINSTNINLQIAAVNAVGTAPFPDSQDVLLNIVTNTRTIGTEPFSEPTLAKRSAIMLLEINNDTTCQLLQTIAFDDTEDPGVRAKAISRIVPSKFPEATKLLNTLLNTLDSENLVPLRAVVDAIMTEPTPANISLVQQKIDRISDPQARKLLLHCVEMSTKGENP